MAPLVPWTHANVRVPAQRRRHTIPPEWTHSTLEWVRRSAQCHLQERAETEYAHVQAYQRLWGLLYFAPFLGPQANPLLELAYRRPPEPRLQACLHLVADVFVRETVRLADLALRAALDDLDGSVERLAWEVRQVLRSRAPKWLVTQVSSGERTHGVFLENSWGTLDAMDAVLTQDYGKQQGDVPVFSWEVKVSTLCSRDQIATK